MTKEPFLDKGRTSPDLSAIEDDAIAFLFRHARRGVSREWLQREAADFLPELLPEQQWSAEVEEAVLAWSPRGASSSSPRAA